MVRENHYKSLRRHIHNLIEGLANHKKELPFSVEANISEEFYQQALAKLEKRKRKLEEREEDYQKAMLKFHEDYEAVRRAWKKDVMKLKRSLRKEEDKLSYFGIYKD